MTIYRIVRALSKLYLQLLYGLKIRGANNIPKDGPVILIANHISNFDPLVVGASVKRPVHFMAKEELFRVPLLKNLVLSLGAFPIKRGGNDRKAIKTGLDILSNNNILGIFPEGTRSKTGEMGQGLPGAALFALKSDAVVIPIGIVASYKLFKPIYVNIGEPLALDSFRKDKLNSEDLNMAINHMMENIKIQIEEIK